MAADISDLHRALGRIEGRLEQIDAKLDRGADRMDGQDERLRRVESSHAYATGRQSIIGSLAGMIRMARASMPIPGRYTSYPVGPRTSNPDESMRMP